MPMHSIYLQTDPWFELTSTRGSYLRGAAVLVSDLIVLSWQPSCYWVYSLTTTLLLAQLDSEMPLSLHILLVW